MRFMTMLRMDEDRPFGQTPPAVFDAMAAFEQEGRMNGTLVEIGELLPSSAGAIISLASGRIATSAAIEAVWRLESMRLIAALVRVVRDVDLAEDVAQDALVAALAQ